MNFWRAKPPAAPFVSMERRIRDLEIVTARLVREGFAGQYHSAFHGRGLEFSQVREYFQGDDVRSIDWNVTARTGVPHVKEFVEERDLTLLIALDVSPSMGFGSLDRRKSELAAELVAVLAYAALKNNDRVGLLTFSDRVHKFVPALRGRAHTLHVVRTAVAAKPSGERTLLAPVASFVERVFRRRAALILLSDFLDVTPGRELARLSNHHDTIAFRLTDPRESIVPRQGLVRLRDAESGQLRTVDLRRSAAEMQQRRAQQLDVELRKRGVDLLELSTAAPYDRALIRFFESRGARRR